MTPSPFPSRGLRRRDWLLQGAAALGSLGLPARALAAADARRPRLVVVMLRGAIDGLNVVVPHGDPAYARARPRLAIARPGEDGGALPLDRLFGLHPAAGVLMPYWQRGLMGFVHASGSPDPTRSHFDAQDFMESGTPGRKDTPDGWMNRLLAGLPGPHSASRALSLGNTPPRIFAGSAPVAFLGTGPKALDPKAIDQARLQRGLARLYDGQDPLSRDYRDATQSRQDMRRSLAQAGQGMQGMKGEAPSRDPGADAGAPSARSFSADARRLGELIRADAQTQLAFTSVGGWDTHVNQGAASGQLATRLGALCEGLDALAQGLGDSLQDTVIVVMSEFGRTVHENGTGGTDHGRGNAMWLLGGPLQGAAGGRVLGEWPGLEDRALADGRDLAISTDFRHVLAPLLHGHLGLGDEALARVFPALPARSAPALTLLRS
ncbi:MAG TPA: DUF1501 domain-containing protein [Burkholderiaceae bacterium]|nr:DUF1501 domain-containing protein [Burkholderiaceae bacterium]